MKEKFISDYELAFNPGYCDIVGKCFEYGTVRLLGVFWTKFWEANYSAERMGWVINYI
jgi:hypothetical protein